MATSKIFRRKTQSLVAISIHPSNDFLVIRIDYSCDGAMDGSAAAATARWRLIRDHDYRAGKWWQRGVKCTY